MPHHIPQVSLGMPVYNGEQFLEEALDSILSQSFEDFELIISDNASTDRTRQICLEYAARDSRIHYARNETNIGAAGNFNRVFELARGAYFKWAAHDDVLAPEFLKRCVEVLDSDETVVLAYPRTVMIDDQGKPLDPYPFNGQYRAEDPAAHKRFHDLLIPPHWCFQVFGLIRTDVLRSTPLIGNYLSSDKVLLVWLGLLGRFHELPEFLFLSRRHAKQSGELISKALKYMAWYDPTHSARITLPHWQEYLGYAAAIRAVPLSPYQRLRCMIAMLDFLRYGRRARYLVKDALLASVLFVSRFVVRRSVLLPSQ